MVGLQQNIFWWMDFRGLWWTCENSSRDGADTSLTMSAYDGMR